MPNNATPPGQAADTDQATSNAVAALYNTYPFPPAPLLDEPPPGYNWRWNWTAAYSFCSGRSPQSQQVRILDAGCGTGVSTEYLVHLNPEADVVGIDLSQEALAIARERCRRSHGQGGTFHQLSLYDVAQLGQTFDLINCVGVLHHLPDPKRGIQALANVLAPGGIMHIFVYAALGRWEIQLMQEAIALLQGPQRGDYKDGVSMGRTLFDVLPENNRLRRREEERWSLENQRDECFADMYVHPQEVDYTVDTLFELIDASGLDFLGFSNPEYWSLERLMGKAPQLLERAKGLSERQRYRLIEVLDPEITHYEFFLARPPFEYTDWSGDRLKDAIPELSPCLDGWPSQTLFDANYKIVKIDDVEFAFLSDCHRNALGETPRQSVGSLCEKHGLPLQSVSDLQRRQLVVLALPT
ncbi:MAG: class I SAM-dependent methyltransferase [Cyanobacteria bacterium P01_A01_bin.135]